MTGALTTILETLMVAMSGNRKVAQLAFWLLNVHSTPNKDFQLFDAFYAALPSRVERSEAAIRACWSNR